MAYEQHGDVGERHADEQAHLCGHVWGSGYGWEREGEGGGRSCPTKESLRFLQMSIQLQNANTLNFELLYTEHPRINVASSTLTSSYDE